MCPCSTIHPLYSSNIKRKKLKTFFFFLFWKKCVFFLNSFSVVQKIKPRIRRTRIIYECVYVLIGKWRYGFAREIKALTFPLLSVYINKYMRIYITISLSLFRSASFRYQFDIEAYPAFPRIRKIFIYFYSYSHVVTRRALIYPPNNRDLCWSSIVQWSLMPPYTLNNNLLSSTLSLSLERANLSFFIDYIPIIKPSIQCLYILLMLYYINNIGITRMNIYRRVSSVVFLMNHSTLLMGISFDNSRSNCSLNSNKMCSRYKYIFKSSL